MGVSVSDLQIEIKTSAVCAGEFVVIAATFEYLSVKRNDTRLHKNHIRNKRVLCLKTVGNSGGDGGGNDEDGSGNFHLDHDEDVD